MTELNNKQLNITSDTRQGYYVFLDESTESHGVRYFWRDGKRYTFDPSIDLLIQKKVSDVTRAQLLKLRPPLSQKQYEIRHPVKFSDIISINSPSLSILEKISKMEEPWKQVALVTLVVAAGVFGFILGAAIGGALGAVAGALGGPFGSLVGAGTGALVMGSFCGAFMLLSSLRLLSNQEYYQ